LVWVYIPTAMEKRINQTCIRVLANPVQISRCRSKLKERNAAIVKLSRILALAGNEVRLKILFLLREEKELCPCDLADILGMSIPAISQHLRKMKDAQIIAPRKAGQTIFYSLQEQHLDVLQPLFEHLLQANKQRV